MRNFEVLVSDSVQKLRTKYPKIKGVQLTQHEAGMYTRIYIHGEDGGFPISQLISVPGFEFDETSSVEHFIEERLDKKLFGGYKV